MFDRHIYINDNRRVKEAARIAAEASQKHDETLREISKNEIQSKNRVDISLAEYEDLQRELTDLRRENASLRNILTRIGIPIRVINHVLPDSIRVQKCDDYKDYKTHYQVIFTTNDIRRELL